MSLRKEKWVGNQSSKQKRHRTSEWLVRSCKDTALCSHTKAYFVHHLFLLKPKTEVEEEAWKGKSPLLQLIKLVIKRLFLVRLSQTIPGITCHPASKTCYIFFKKDRTGQWNTEEQPCLCLIQLLRLKSLAIQGNTKWKSNWGRKSQCLSPSVHFLLHTKNQYKLCCGKKNFQRTGTWPSNLKVIFCSFICR